MAAKTTTKTNHIEIQAHRTAYAAEDVRRTLTIRELIEALEEQAEELGDDAPVYLSHDNGYTFGGIDWEDLWAVRYCWAVTVANASPYCSEEYLREEFEDEGEARARFAEVAETFDADHWVVGESGIDLMLFECEDRGEVCLECVELRDEA